MRDHGVNLDVYLSGYPRKRLSRSEEQRIGALPFGHPDRWALVHHNMRFAVQWCIRLFNRNRLVTDFDALLGVAQDAMIEVAIKRYEARGTPFVSYAAHYIRRDTTREVHRQLCVVKLPELREENREDLREDCRYEVSLDSDTIKDVPENTLFPDAHDGGHGEVEHEDLRVQLLAELQRLVPKESDRQIVIMAYGLDGKEPMTSTEIREALGRYSREGIRKVLIKCRKNLSKSRILKDLVD